MLTPTGYSPPTQQPARPTAHTAHSQHCRHTALTAPPLPSGILFQLRPAWKPHLCCDAEARYDARLLEFVTQPAAREAELRPEHVHALRLYSSAGWHWGRTNNGDDGKVDCKQKQSPEEHTGGGEKYVCIEIQPE